MKRKILGPPGTGKTTRLTNIVNDYLKKGGKSDKVAYLAFTRRAALEAINKIQEVTGYSKKQFPYFRTIHSLCFRELLLTKTDIVQKEHLVELGDELGLDIRCRGSFEEGGIWGFSDGDKIVTLENMSRVNMTSLKQIWEDDDNEILWEQLETFRSRYTKYKEEKNLVDFTDMLDLLSKNPIKKEFDLVIVDEAQDLSKMQWNVINSINTKRLYTAGDDDQAIYTWSGADVNSFIDFKGDIENLIQSHRLPYTICKLATELATTIKNRIHEKKIHPTEEEGSIHRIVDLDELSFDQGSWLLLARNAYQLAEYEELCITRGVPYEIAATRRYRIGIIKAIKIWTSLRKGYWHSGKELKKLLKHLSFKKNSMLEDNKNYNMDYLVQRLSVKNSGEWFDVLTDIGYEEIEFFRSALRRKEDIEFPRVRISTIHGAKGAEADHVVVMTDISRKAFDRMEENLDDETRVFYVAITRAKSSLYIVSPTSRYYYDI